MLCFGVVVGLVRWLVLGLVLGCVLGGGISRSLDVVRGVGHRLVRGLDLGRCVYRA